MRKQSSRIFALILSTAMLLLNLPVTIAGAEEVTPTNFFFNCHNKTGYVGEIYGPVGILSYSFEPYGSSEEVYMTSSDTDVVNVEYDETYGRWAVDYRELGTAVITATTASGLTDACTITVKEMETAYVDQPFTVTVQPNDTLYYRYVAEDYGYYSFYSEEGTGYLNVRARTDPYYAPGVDHSELTKGEEVALAIQNKSSEEQIYTLCVKKSVPAEKILFEEENYSGYPGESVVIRFSADPVWSIPEEYTLTSSDENVACFESDGSRWLTLVNPGTTTITVTSESGISAQCTATVYGYEEIGVGDSKTITLGHQESQRYVFTPEADGEYVFYMPRGELVLAGEDESGNPIAYTKDFNLSITPNGLNNSGSVDGSTYCANYVTTHCKMNAGETYVLCAINQWAAEVEITGTVYLAEVTEPQAITISGEKKMIPVGSSLSLVCEPEYGLPFITGDVTWSVEDESVATLNYLNGDTAIFEAVGVGTTKVTATLDNGVSATYEIEVFEYVNYPVTEGNFAKVTAGNGETLSFRIDCPIEKFASCVTVDDVEVSTDSYTVIEGSTIITLTPDYLNTLTVGTHVLRAEFTDGAAYAFFEIKDMEEESGSVIRLSGKDRYLTAFAVANRLKELMGVTRFDTVIVAYGQNFPDALTGSYLAAVKNAPILLTEPNKDALVLEYISENLTSGGKVYILGGTAAVSENFENSAKEAGFDVVRLKGKGRYETNLEILKEAGVNETDEILIATGTNFADSLSASATKLPMLLVGPGLTAEQKDFLATTSRKFVIIGGTGAVNEAVEAELAQIGTVERIKGKTRYETSVVIAERYFTDPAAAVLAYAQGFPDGLCGGPLAMNMGAPLILTSNESPTAADDYIEGITVGAVTGGTGRISDETVREIFDLEADAEIPKP